MTMFSLSERKSGEITITITSPEGNLMRLQRRQFLQLGGALGAATTAPAFSRRASALDYPVRPVRLIVGFPAGGPQDIVARLMGQWLGERLGQQFIIENRSGADGNIGAEAVVHAARDGYTLLLCGSPNAISASLYDRLNFVFLRDLAPVAGIARVPLVMEVNPSLPVTSVPQFIAYAKTMPGRINFASAGIGSPQHVAGELFKQMSGISMIHVPYRGAAPALTDLIGGQVQVMLDPTTASIGYIRAGKLRPIAMTSARRWSGLPDIPTVAESLPGFEATSWYGLCAPTNAPAEVIERLNREVNTALADPAKQVRLADLGCTVMPGSPDEFGVFLARETEKWAKVVKASGAKAE
jgi:tripartite-type tricarboxylate transporter receptor subunit TctC